MLVLMTVTLDKLK